MTPIGTDLPGRCTSCGCDPRPDVQGHRLPCTPTGRMANLELARQRRDEGMARTVDAHPDDAALVDRVLADRIRRGGVFSLNDLRPALTAVKEKHVIGARVQAAARAKRIVRVGYVPSTDPRTNGHPIAEWQAA